MSGEEQSRIDIDFELVHSQLNVAKKNINENPARSDFFLNSLSDPFKNGLTDS